jgi:hypothetical protein
MISSEAPARKPVLKLDWCSHAAAKYAVEHWHYSRRMPMPPIVSIGVWEDSAYIGCVLFARGANMNIGTPYGLSMTQCAELVRVAITSHATPVTRIVAVAFKFLRSSSPGLRLLVSYADPSEGHHGGIYQGGGWVYAGRGSEATEFLHDGRWKHQREVTAVSFASTGHPGSGKASRISELPRRTKQGKHKYLMPLDDAMRAQIAPLAKPYPKRLCAVTSTPPGAPERVGGATPTTALQP